jgi:hypothetical protein
MENNNMENNNMENNNMENNNMENNRFSILILEKDVLEYNYYKTKYNEFESITKPRWYNIFNTKQKQEEKMYWYNKYIGKMKYIEENYRKTNIYTQYHSNIENNTDTVVATMVEQSCPPYDDMYNT